MTSGTYGPPGPGSSASVALQSSLASRLQARLDGIGSPLFVLTWKGWDMRSGPPICAQRARGRRISDSDYISWPTPLARDRKGKQTHHGNLDLPGAAELTYWPTTRCVTGGPESAARKQELGRLRSGGSDLQAVALMVDLAEPARLTASGELLTGCLAGMANGGRLSPEHSRWLMGYPPAWCRAAVDADAKLPRGRGRAVAASAVTATP
jgi:hypothetical protein